MQWFWNIWDKVSKSGLSKFFKGCLPQNLLSPLLNTLSHLNVRSKGGSRKPVTFKMKFCDNSLCLQAIEDYVRCYFFCEPKREHMWNMEKCFSFHFENSVGSWDNQLLTCQIFKWHDVIKYLSMKHKTRFAK